MPADDKGNKFEIVATAGGHLDEELGVRNIGQYPRDQWLKEVAKSKFMVSAILLLHRSELMYSLRWEDRISRRLVSLPASRVIRRLTNSAYDALCFGVPFINVYVLLLD
jgi:hypothetical protein